MSGHTHIQHSAATHVSRVFSLLRHTHTYSSSRADKLLTYRTTFEPRGPAAPQLYQTTRRTPRLYFADRHSSRMGDLEVQAVTLFLPSLPISPSTISTHLFSTSFTHLPPTSPSTPFYILYPSPSSYPPLTFSLSRSFYSLYPSLLSFLLSLPIFLSFLHPIPIYHLLSDPYTLLSTSYTHHSSPYTYHALTPLFHQTPTLLTHFLP